MDILDKKILNSIQSWFPIEEKPFLIIGNELGIGEEEALMRVRRLKEEGIIRRIGASFNSRRLGFDSTLITMKVPEERIEEVVLLINGYKEVTHNYLRDNEYNIWFTLIAHSGERIKEIIEEIASKSGISDIRNLPTKRFFKVNVDLNFRDEED
ncbi:MAG: Lrp/AsnC family transcriptional regulator [Nitrospinae bacterium]|nr:Lrp/AsnC family transcriptional regulator [Nitrospinota bacterium]